MMVFGNFSRIKRGLNLQTLSPKKACRSLKRTYGNSDFRPDPVKGAHDRYRGHQYHEYISLKDYLGNFLSVQLDATPTAKKKTIAEGKINPGDQHNHAVNAADSPLNPFPEWESQVCGLTEKPKVSND